MIDLLIENRTKGVWYRPLVEDGVDWETQRKSSPGKLTFTIKKDDVVDFQEGSVVRFCKDGQNVFYGFVFQKSRDKNDNIKVTAYDQLRYFKNKDTYVYKEKTVSEFLEMIAADFHLKVGEVEDTGYVIPSRVEDNKTLFDMIGNALDLTLTNTGNMFILYDDFGSLTLKSLANMKTNVLICADTCEDFDYTSSIDDNTYNQIKLSYENKDTGKREIYIAKDTAHINEWGVLQYFETIDEKVNGQVQADAMLNLYNAKTRNLKIKKAFGDLSVRAGSLIPVIMNLGDIIAGNYFLVENCKHTFNNDEHFMDLTLRGGEFVE